ncbi:coiled-coil domain-containing protein 33 isoform X4 [Struthio camelus]|uniref:coiled-coil domain-containing protein 33 isoform X4 n=1 Tax=Struthio camelus TaxID=8801 RepID=UPI003603FFDB
MPGAARRGGRGVRVDRQEREGPESPANPLSVGPGRRSPEQPAVPPAPTSLPLAPSRSRSPPPGSRRWPACRRLASGTWPARGWRPSPSPCTAPATCRPLGRAGRRGPTSSSLTLTVADQGTKEALAIYRLPVRHLQPFHHYHCRLALPRQKDPVGTSLYVTVVRKGSVIPRSEGMDYAALEVLLQGMTAPLAGPRGALVAVASIVTNVRAYEEGMAKRPAARPGVALTTVTFPEPSAADFSLGHAADRGCPQRPDTFLSPASSAALPSLDATSLGMLQGTQELLRPLGPPGPRGQDEPPEVRAGLHQGDASLPPADAVAGILPEKPPYPRETAAAPEEQRCQDGARDQQDQEATNYRLALERMADDILSLRQHVASLEVENSNLRRSLAMHEDPGRTLLSDIDVDVMTRAEILDRIATLKCKLASGTVEMRSLKDRVQQLQNELIRKNDQEKDLVMLQRAHQQQQAVLRRYEEKVAKMKGLEETVRQQEKVIETMERMLEERLSEAGRSTQKPAGEALARELYDALLAENRRLREELARPRHPSPPVAPPPQALPDVFSGSEKVSLLAKLEKEQARSRVLESQLEEASRRWGREKQELSTRLLEQDHGFRGWSSSFAHDLAMKMPLDPTAPVKRHQTLDPLP